LSAGIPDGEGSGELRSDGAWLGLVEAIDGDWVPGGFAQPAIMERQSNAVGMKLRIHETPYGHDDAWDPPVLRGPQGRQPVTQHYEPIVSATIWD